MTTTMTTRSAGTLNPTRQQLDELDALLQRMLELPVQPLDKPEQAREEEPEEGPPPSPPIFDERPAPVSRISRLQPVDSGRPVSTLRLTLPPVSYTVVETATPRPLPPASGFEPKPSMLAPRLVPVSPPETPTVLPSPVAEAEASEAETWVPLRSTWQPSDSTWPPLAASWHQANSGTPSPAASNPTAESLFHKPEAPAASVDPALALRVCGTGSEPRPEPLPPSPPEPELTVDVPVPLPANEPLPETQAPEISTPDQPQLRLSAENAPVRVAWPLLPLLWFNQGFDACLAPFGAPGRWLSGRGRVVLGLLGLACLAGAVAIAVNSGMGWSW